MRIEEQDERVEPHAETLPEVPNDSSGIEANYPPLNSQRARRSRHDAGGEPLPEAQASSHTRDAAESLDEVNLNRDSIRSARGEKRRRPRAPLAQKTAFPSSSTSAGEDEFAEDSESASAGDSSTAAAEALVINLSGKKPNRGARTAKRAQRKQQDAAAALEGADQNPALGALNRHLNMMMQQLGTAHRVIGRIAAERDALRQQLADLQGIPVEEIVVTSLGTALDQQASSASKPLESKPATGISRLNYFGGDDVALMRKRRQTFVLGLLVFVLVLWLTARLGAWQMPTNLSRDSLTALPYIGDFMTYFLAGWLFFRVIKVSSKGVKWVFPSDDPRRRRR